MPPKKNVTKTVPAKTTEKKTIKKKEKRILKTPTIIKFQLPSAKTLHSKTKMLPPNTTIMPTKKRETNQDEVTANKENPDSHSSLSFLKSKSMPEKTTRKLKRKLDMKVHELAEYPDSQSNITSLKGNLAKATKAKTVKFGVESIGECNTGSKNINLALVNTKRMPEKVTKVTKQKLETVTVKDNSDSQSDLAPVKEKRRVIRSRKNKDAKVNTENNLTNGGMRDSPNLYPLKVKIMRPKLKRTAATKKIDSTSAEPVCQSNIHSLKTTLVPAKTTKAGKRCYTAVDAKERKIELANEVALDQLGIKPAFVEPMPPPPVKPANGVNKRRGRKPKQPGAKDNPTAVATEEPTKTKSKKKAPKKSSSAKHSGMDMKEALKKSVKNNAPSIMKADSTSKKSTKKPKVTGSHVAPQVPSKVKRKYVRRKGKDLNDITSTDPKSPSILEGLNDERIATIDTPSGKAVDAVATRRYSQGSVSDCLSWTKDISDSSTTTFVTVCSSDFVRIDNKLPIIKLLNCDNTLKPNDSSEDDDSDSTEETSESSSDSSPALHSLNTSSVSPPKSQATSAHANGSLEDDLSKVGYALAEIVSNLKKIDLEVLNWLGPANEKPDDNYKQFEENVFKVLTTEKELIMHCRETKRRFIYVDTSGLGFDNEISTAKLPIEEKLIEINLFGPVCNTNTDSPELEDGEIESSGSENEMDSPEDGGSMLPPRTADNPQRGEQMSVDNIDDDDDALSLFAESFTGIDSLRAKTSPVRFMSGSPGIEEDVLKPIEAYVPLPVFVRPPEPTAPKITYLPTKIVNDKATTVCEKQNAEPASNYSETSNNKERVAIGNVDNEPKKIQTATVNSTINCKTVNIRPPIANSQDQVLLMNHVVQPIKIVKSLVFKGVCFFNLISKCKMIVCRYPHVQMPVEEVIKRLAQLTEEMFMKEYLMLRSWSVLQRLYGMCFVKECDRRGLTRVLIEMAIDAIKMENTNIKEDGKFKIEAIEVVLLHLNDQCLQNYSDLLKYNVPLKPLCHIFMETIAETQNFSRFKSVFIQLTRFTEANLGSFTLNVANQILERVCILPFEAPLAHALMLIIKNTDERILSNRMMPQLEKQLSAIHRDLYNELVAYKKQVLAKRPDLTSPQAPDDVAPMSLLQSDREMYQSPAVVQPVRERYTSLDTVTLDNMNKAANEPVITRKVNLSASSHVQSFTSNSSTSHEGADYRPPVKSKFRRWRPMIYNNANNVGMRYHRPMMRPPLRPMLMRPTMRPYMLQRQVTYGPSPSNFPRRHGPDNM